MEHVGKWGEKKQNAKEYYIMLPFL